MPVKEYTIKVNGKVVWVKYCSQDFRAICDYLDREKINYTFEIKSLINK